MKRRPSSWSGSEAGSELVPGVAVEEFCACDDTKVMVAAASVQAAIASGTNLVMAAPPAAPQAPTDEDSNQTDPGSVPRVQPLSPRAARQRAAVRTGRTEIQGRL